MRYHGVSHFFSLSLFIDLSDQVVTDAGVLTVLKFVRQKYVLLMCLLANAFVIHSVNFLIAFVHMIRLL